MKRFAGLAFVAVAMLAVAPVQADDHSCCGKNMSAKKSMCADYTKLNLSPEQKSQLMALQDKCDKAGGTKESRAQFLKSAKKILSAQQYAQLRAECAKTEKKQG